MSGKCIGIDGTAAGIALESLSSFNEAVKKAHQVTHERTGAGSDFLGWVDWPVTFDQDEYDRLKNCAERIRKNADVLLVIGIGGSYLGAKAAMDALCHTFYNQLPREQRGGPEIHFVGQNISGTYLTHLLETLEGKSVYVNVISKSGTTTEPALAFRIIRNYLIDRLGREEADRRIVATTDKARGALRTFADQNGYETFIIPDDIGGRYSILTPVGLLPMAVAGIDIDAFMKGASDARDEYAILPLEENPAYQYAAMRHMLHGQGKLVEILVSYEPSMASLSEWWKQLYGESEGKEGKGLYPASLVFSTDLHSMGQYVQDGNRILFETVLQVAEPKEDQVVPHDEEDLDQLNFLSGKTMSEVNRMAFKGTLLAHVDGGAPNLVINIKKMDAYHFGNLLYFFMKACAISGYMLGVNPFDQPGVEAYKKNMFALLGKKGYESLAETLNKRL